MAALTVEVVSPESRLWSGEAAMVSARTIEGDIGVLPNHSELLGVLAEGEVVVKASDGSEHKFNLDGGFISVAKNRVSILGQVKV